MHKRIVGVDTLRFLAILMVVVYHCFPNFYAGGFIAVEIFFVISGYFICNMLIHSSINEQHFGGLRSFWTFFWDRIKRFAPVLLFCIVLTLTTAFFADPDLLTGSRENTLYAATFSTNIANIARNLSYEQSIIPNLFNHTWFLALELQLCIIFFVLLAVLYRIFISKKSPKTYKHFYAGFGIATLLLAIISYTLMHIYGSWFALHDRAYFGPDSHAGAFLLGAALSCFMMTRATKSPKRSTKIILAIIAAILTAGIMTLGFFANYSASGTYTYILALTAVISAAIMYAIMTMGVTEKPKLLIPFEYLGRISFAVYLLHYPFNILFPSIFRDIPLAVIPYIAIAASLVLAILLDKVFTPFSKKHKIIFCIILAASLILPVWSLIKAPAKSSIEEQLEQERANIEETVASEPPAIDINSLDYSGGIGLSKTIESTMDYFEASKNFAKPRPVVKKSGGGYTKAGSYNAGGRAAWNTPNLSNLSALSNARVLVLGDSVVLGAQSAIKSTISGVYVDAMGSRNMADAINLLATYRSANGGNLPRIIVIGLVTNYYAFTADTLQTIVNTAGADHQFVFMTGYCGDYSRQTQNNNIRAFAQSHGNVHVGDWEALIRNNVGYYTGSDHIHLSPNGRTAYANLINGIVSGL